jgi:hypothetical protein
MTANRWWVRMAARWLARIDGVNGQLRLLFLAMTGYGIVLQTLAQYGLGGYALEFLGVSGIALAVYTYYYNEGGVRNQVSRDRVDLSTNFAGPTMRMDDELIARGIVAGLESRELDEDRRRAIKGELDAGWTEYRDGLPPEYFDHDT